MDEKKHWGNPEIMSDIAKRKEAYLEWRKKTIIDSAIECAFYAGWEARRSMR